MKITPTSDHIRIEGHIGTWYVIDHGYFTYTHGESGMPKTARVHCFLLEHEQYGDEAACLIVNGEGSVIMDDVWNGLDDLREDHWKEKSE